jgi:hypothetical protein
VAITSSLQLFVHFCPTKLLSVGPWKRPSIWDAFTELASEGTATRGRATRGLFGDRTLVLVTSKGAIRHLKSANSCLCLEVRIR